jgi:uncharacterized protein (TIGR00369 family)
MEVITHQKINQELCGKPLEIKEGYSRVELVTLESMAADKTGLVHGGFIFGQADYAAMIAVNHPNVVLGGADVKFLKPVKAGEKVLAQASVTAIDGKKNTVEVVVTRGKEKVFQGTFFCFVLGKHVLNP